MSAPPAPFGEAHGGLALDVANLTVSFPGSDGGVMPVVDGVSMELRRGEALGIVGESGSGKTMTSLALLGLVPRPGRVRADRIVVDGIDVAGLGDRRWPAIRGKHISMVFQDALSGLNPVRTVGSTLVETVRRHQHLSRVDAKAKAIEAISAVGIPEPETRFDTYPHQLSGGLRQRVMIALALINRPAVVVADEPTTALDATIQAQILGLLRELMTDAALILVTHDVGVAAAICDRVAVMYAGRFVEVGPVDELLTAPHHPYTSGLLAAVPTFDRDRAPLVPIPGSPPNPAEIGRGCAFAPRCARALERCGVERPELLEDRGHPTACWNPEPQ